MIDMDRLSLDGYVKNDSGIYLPSNRIIAPSESDRKYFVGGDKMKGLEQMLEKVEYGKHKSIDIYTVGTTVLYSGPDMHFSVPLAYNSAPNLFERQTNLFEYGLPPLPEIKLPEIRLPEIPYIEGAGCIGRNTYEMDQGWKMQERFDFSGHNGTEPHLNYDIMNPLGSVKPKLSSNFLDNSHQIDLGSYLK